MLDTIAVPLITASVFTLGGYGIVRAGPRHAEWIEHILILVFMLCAFLATLATAARLAGSMVTEESRTAAQIRQSKISDRILPVSGRTEMNAAQDDAPY